MVLLVLTAMATTSKILYPQINNTVDKALAEKYREISKYLLLSEGFPSNWGQNCQIVPENFGLAKTNSENPYDLDIDKISRLNSENLYAVSYAEAFTALKMPDVSFRIEIKAIFNITINLVATSMMSNETIYQFEILTQQSCVPIDAELKYYVIAENYLETKRSSTSNGMAHINGTIPNDVNGPAILVVLAEATFDSRIVSYDICTFAHNSAAPKPKDTFLSLGLLNHTLNASFIFPRINISQVYALSTGYYSTLKPASSSNQSATYGLPNFLDSSPTIIVVTGWNSTNFFTEWAAYPQIPLQMGANFDLTSLSNVFVYNYLVTVDSAFYQCSIWLGGPKE